MEGAAGVVTRFNMLLSLHLFGGVSANAQRYYFLNNTFVNTVVIHNNIPTTPRRQLCYHSVILYTSVFHNKTTVFNTVLIHINKMILKHFFFYFGTYIIYRFYI